MPEKVLDLLDKTTIQPDEFMYTSIFNACKQLNNDRARKFGYKFIDQIPNHFRKNDFVLTSMIHMLMKFGNISHAEEIFELIKKKDIVSYGAVFKGKLL